MLATPWQRAFTDPGWAFDLKWDGVRAVLDSNAEGAVLRSRNGNIISGTYPELAVSGLGAVLDGEIVAMDDAGRPSFDRLQGRMNVRGLATGDSAIPVHYVVFDLLVHQGQDLRSRTHDERRATLGRLALPPGFVLGDSVLGEGQALFGAVQDQGLEGIVAKRRESVYQSGVRSPDWRKVLNLHTATVIVGGYLPSQTARPFRSLVMGLWDGERLRYVGSVGSGFDEAGSQAIRAALDEMRTDESVFWPDAALEDAVLVAPTLVAHISYRTWTSVGRLRHPVFKGFGDEAPTTLTWVGEGPGSTLERANE